LIPPPRRASGRVDPRRAFVVTLLDALGDQPEPIVVYSRYEARVLDELAQGVAEHAGALLSVRP
jgi:hypothetical protein